MKQVRNLSLELQNSVKNLFEDKAITDKILYYIKYCSENDYEKIANEANVFWDKFALLEEQKMLDRLNDRMQDAQKRVKEQAANAKKQPNLPTSNSPR